MNTSPLLPLHRRAGARLLPPEAGETLLTYGDVPAEYRAGLEGALLLDATERGALRVSGDDAEAFLHRITANSVRGLEPGTGAANLLLTGKGKIVCTFDLEREADGFFLSTPPGTAAGLLEALDMYLFAEDVALADVGEEHAPLELCGPAAARILEAVLGEAPPTQARRTAELGDGVRVTALPVAGSPGYRVDAGPEAVIGLWERLVAAGATPGGLVARDCLRVEAGVAEWGRDVDENVYPQEARLEDAFSLDKGCYIGQEVVAKIDTYGGLNKRLHALAVDHDDPVPPGTRLMREQDGEWRDLGLVTSWAYSFALDTGVVLGYVKRKHQEPDTVFRLGDGPATARLVALPLRAGVVPVETE